MINQITDFTWIQFFHQYLYFVPEPNPGSHLVMSSQSPQENQGHWYLESSDHLLCRMFFRLDLSSHDQIEVMNFIKNIPWGFPGSTVVENPPANAGDTGSSPGLGRSHMPRSNWAREPQLLSLRVRSLCSATREAAIVRGPRTAMKSGPRSPQLKKALAQKRRPNTPKINK